jgi:hypothetical protein
MGLRVVSCGDFGRAVGWPYRIGKVQERSDLWSGSKNLDVLIFSRPTVGFSGSGGAGKTPSLTKTFAGLRRIP